MYVRGAMGVGGAMLQARQIGLLALELVAIDIVNRMPDDNDNRAACRCHRRSQPRALTIVKCRV